MTWKVLVGLLLSGLFLWLAFRNAQFDEVAAAISSADYFWMIPMVVMTLLSFTFRSWRWRFLLASAERVPFLPLLSATFIGFMGNNVLPARLGELMRVQALHQSIGVSRSSALGSIVIERILDVSMLLLLFAVVWMSGRLPEDVRSWGGYLLVFVLPILSGIVIFRLRSEFFIGLLERFAPRRWKARLVRMATHFRDGISVIDRGRDMVIAALLSVLMWGCLVGVVVFCFRSLSLDLPADAGVIVLVIMAIGTMVPSAPGFIGTLQYAGTLALEQYGVDSSVALSFTLIYHASQWFPVTAIGLWFFARQHLNLRQLQSVAEVDP